MEIQEILVNNEFALKRNLALYGFIGTRDEYEIAR
jgi:hypothetical protein